MRKKITFLKTFLIAAGLCMGSSAWATTTKTLYSQNFDTETSIPTGWTQASGTLSLETSGSNKWLRETTVGSGSRTAWYTGTAIKDAISTYTTYTLEFDCLIKEGTNTTNYAQGVWVTGSNLAQSWGTPTGYAIGVMKGSNATTYKIQANGADTGETVNLSSNTWYHYVCAYDHSSKEITFSILSQDKSSTIYAAKAFDYDYSADGKGVFQSIHFQAGRGSGYTEIDNILLTTEVDEEVVSDPIIDAPNYVGANRTVTITGGTSSESKTVHTYYTLDGSEPTSLSSEYSSALTITEDCTLKAITISSTGVTSAIIGRAITVGKLTLNAPTFSMTAYSAGNYTVEILSNQSDLEYVPESPVVKYSIDGNVEQTYSSAIAVPAGSIVTAYVEADNYTNSSVEEWETATQPNLPVSWTQNYVGIVDVDATLQYSTTTSAYENCILSNVGDNYYVYSSDGTNAFTNANVGFQVYNGSSPRKWMIRKSTGGGGMYNFTAGSAGVGIANLTIGQIVKIEWTTSPYGGVTLSSGVTKLDKISYGTVGYFEVTTDGTAYFNAARNAYIKNVTVYDENVTATATIGSTGWTTFASSYALDLANMTVSEGDVTAFYASAVSGGTVTMTSTDATVAAGTGLMLKGTAGATVTIPVAVSGDPIAGNLLVGCTSEQILTANADLYVLVNNGGTAEFQSLEENGATIPAGKAYLNAKANGAKLRIAFEEDDATGIKAIATEEVKDNVIYNLSGQRVVKPLKGIYIQNGKKILVK